MPTLNFPDLGRKPSQFEFNLQANTQKFVSPLDGSTQTLELPGARWIAKLTYNDLTQQQGRQLFAFLSSLRGASGRFYLWDMSLELPMGVATGTPVVNGASQTGSSLATNGWATSVNNLLFPGDMIGVNGELKIVTQAVNSDATGAATVTFEPPLRSSPPSGTAIVLTKPTATFMLNDDKQNEGAWKPPMLTDITFQCMEVLT